MGKMVKTFNFLLFISVTLCTRTSNFVLLHTGNVQENSMLTTDYLGNYYVVSPQNDIDKFSPSGEKLATFNAKVYGNVTYIDASNPFDIYVFYSDQNRLIFLDNLLNNKGEVDFSRIGFVQLGAVCRSYDNGIWVFDMNDLKLKKLKKDLTIELVSGNALEIDSKYANPRMMTDNNKEVFISFSGTGVAQYDIFGNHIKTLDIKECSNFQLYSNKLFFLTRGTLKVFDLKFFSEKELPLPESSDSVNQVRIEKNTYYCMYKNSIKLYKITEN